MLHKTNTLSHCVLVSLKVSFLQLNSRNQYLSRRRFTLKRLNKEQVVRTGLWIARNSKQWRIQSSCFLLLLVIHHILAEELHLPVVSDVAGSESSSAASKEAESNCSLSESRDSPSITDPLAWKPFTSSLPSSGDMASGGAGSAGASGWGLGFLFFLGWTLRDQCQPSLYIIHLLSVQQHPIQCMQKRESFDLN